VHLGPNINYRTYPVPSDFLKAVTDDLIMKIERNEINRKIKKNFSEDVMSQEDFNKFKHLKNK